MSMMKCSYCKRSVDTDQFPESLYIIGHEGKCVCIDCTEIRSLQLEDHYAPEIPYLARLI